MRLRSRSRSIASPSSARHPLTLGRVPSSRGLLAGLVVCVGLAAPAHAQWVAGSWRAQRLGFFDAVHTRNDGQQVSSVQGSRLGLDGLTVGASDRYLGENLVGASVWGNTRSLGQQRLGFFDEAHTGPNGEQESAIGGQVGLAAGRRSPVNISGQVMGYSTRYDGAGPNGRSAWVWGPQTGLTRLGLFSGLFVGPQGEQYSTPISIDDAGRVAGYSQRFDVPGSQFASIPPVSAWLYTPGQGEQLIGLIDAVHTRSEDGYQRHEPRGLNNSGLVVGISYRFDTLDPTQAGQSAWVWTASGGTRRVGPVGSRYIEPFSNLQYAYVLPPTGAGDVAGASWQFAPGSFDVGREAWVLPAGQTQPVILGFKDTVHTAPDGTQRSEPTVLKYDGPLRVAGYSARYNPVFAFAEGRSAWSWTPGEGLIDIGLKDAEHTSPTGNRDSAPIFATPNGVVVGFAQRFSGTLDRTGQSIWVWTPPTPAQPQGRTTRLGLTDSLHTALDGFQRSEVYGLTDSGFVYGVSYRYNGRLDTDNTVGRTIWVYNVNSGQQQSLVFSSSTSGDAAGLPLGMSESGVLGGYYLEYLNDQIFAQRAFYWDAARGLTTVNALLQGGPAANLLENAFFADTLDEDAGAAVIYAMPPGVIWNPTGIGSWATAYRIDRVGPATPCDPDVNQDGVSDQGDVDYLINTIAGGGNPNNTNPDFNNDGVADQGDVDALINVIAGAQCP